MQILLILNVKWTRSWPPTARLKVVLIWFKVLSVFREQWAAALLLCSKTINIVWLCSMLRGIVCRQCAAALSSQILDSLLVTMSPNAEEIEDGWTTVGNSVSILVTRPDYNRGYSLRWSEEIQRIFIECEGQRHQHYIFHSIKKCFQIAMI